MPTRRQFLVGSLAAAGTVGALIVGWSVLPVRQRLIPGRPVPVAPGQVALNGWVKIAADNRVTVVVPNVEMGQGTHTGLAMLLADELDAAWDQVAVEQSTLDTIYNNLASVADALPFRPDDDGFIRRSATHVITKLLREVPGMLVTGGSSSIKDLWQPMREAGASARALLIQAAAAQWKVPIAECRAENGRVLHASGRSARFGELAERAVGLPLPREVALKSPGEFKLIGKPIPRLERHAKLDGSAVFGIDVRPEGLLFASVAMCPTVGGRVRTFDATAALAMPGVKRVIALEPAPGGLGSAGAGSGGVAAIANTSWQAMKAVAAVRVEWEHGSNADVFSSQWADHLAQTLNADAGYVHYETGDVEGVQASVVKTVEAEYRVPHLAHATMEPMNCTVQFKDGRAKVWAPTQMPAFAVNAVADVLGIAADHVELKIPYLGGGFGRRAFSDFVVQAAAIARETDGLPVQTVWTRETDMTHDFYRPAFVARGKIGIGSHDQLVSWQLRTAGQSMDVPDMMDASSDGAFNTAYAFPNARISHKAVEGALPIGIWRSVNNSQNAFFTECLIDEAAFAANRDPMTFRKSLLAHSPRHLRVLDRIAELSHWGVPLPPAPAPDGARQAQGLAIHRCFGSIVAQVAQVSLSPSGRIRVHRVVCVIDCGFALNPGMVRQQMESSIVYGLSAALHGAITFDRGRVQQSNFHDYPVIRMQDCPVIETDIIPSAEPPEGVGEPGTPPIAPAVANAMFALTGKRLRALPLQVG